MMNFMLAYQRVYPCIIQSLKTKGHFVTRENLPLCQGVETKGHFVAKAMLGKNGAQQPHSIAPSL